MEKKIKWNKQSEWILQEIKRLSGCEDEDDIVKTAILKWYLDIQIGFK